MPKRDDSTVHERALEKRRHVTLTLDTAKPVDVPLSSSELNNDQGTKDKTACKSTVGPTTSMSSDTDKSNQSQSTPPAITDTSAAVETPLDGPPQLIPPKDVSDAEANPNDKPPKSTSINDKSGAKHIRNVAIRQKEDGRVTSVSVKSLVPIPTTKLVDDQQVASYNAALLQRINMLSTYYNKEANVYALGKLLPTATWGIFQPQGDHRSELCNPSCNEPIVIWTVGHIVSTWFVRNGELDRQASVTVIPLSQSLGQQYATLMSGLSSPASKTFDNMLNVVRAIKWQSERGSNSPTLFDSVYDAREHLTNKSDMELILATELKKNDLVLLEGKIMRYRAQDDKKKWTIQHAQMELLAVSLLACADFTTNEEGNQLREIKGLCI